MRSVLMLAIAAAAVSGCLAHERPEPEDAAAPRSDAYFGHDAAHLVPFDANLRDAFNGDAFEPLYCHVVYGYGYGPPLWSLAERACAMDAPECVTFEVDTLDPVQQQIQRCAPGSTQTLVRVTVLQSNAAGVVRLTPCDGDACEAAFANAGDVVELRGIEGPQLAADYFGSDLVTCSLPGAGNRYLVQACAIGPCP